MNRRLNLPMTGLLICAAGCGTLGRRMARAPVSRVLPPDATCQQVVAEVNRNVLGDGVRPGLASWRSDHARVSVTGLPVSLQSSIAVEAPRSLRIRVAGPVGGNAMDLGSNGNEYWIWSKEMDPNCVLVGQHGCEVEPRLAEVMPFEPEWLLDVLGVTPISPADVRMTGGGDTVELISDHRTPAGQRVEKVKRVSLVTGEILGHEVREPSGRTIAKADVRRQVRCPQTGLLLPAEVRVVWPDFAREMKIRIGQHCVNPRQMTASTFEKPMRPSWQVVALTRPAAAATIHRTADVSPPDAERNPFEF